ncbi:MAG: DUF1559 domain-containing protein [Planctomycetes bacterium]|nr:DUF1559 domain-containing protein [Planctomycetota bacterium]
MPRTPGQGFQPTESTPEFFLQGDEPRRSKLRIVWVLAGIAVVGFVGFLFLPNIARVRGHSQRSPCTNNLKQISLALQMYHDTHGTFPPAYIADEDGRPMHSWRVLILPYIGQQHLFDQYNFDEPWDGPNNRLLADQIPDTFQCPSAEHTRRAVTDYMVVVGDNTIFPHERTSKHADIVDGTAFTIAVVEVAGSTTNWMEPKDLNFDTLWLLVNARDDGSSISSNHSGGALVAMADGSVHFLPDSIPPKTLRHLLDRRDGYSVDVP